MSNLIKRLEESLGLNLWKHNNGYLSYIANKDNGDILYVFNGDEEVDVNYVVELLHLSHGTIE